MKNKQLLQTKILVDKCEITRCLYHKYMKIEEEK